MTNDLARLEASVRDAIARCRAAVESFLALDAGAGLHEVLQAFDRITLPLNGWSGRVALYTHVHPDEAVRDACERLEQEIAALATEIALDRRLYDRLARLDPARADDPAERRLLEHALRDFRRAGVDQDAPARERIRALREELVRVGQEFERNIVQGGRSYVVADGHAGLAGLPPDFLAAHPERADGTVLLSTDPTDRIPVLSFAERDDVRKAYFHAGANRAVPENLAVLPRLLARRHELATLLGHAHWADYVTDELMSKSAARAREFIERVVGLVRERARREVLELLELKRERVPGATAVDESERLFLGEKLKERRYGLDARALRAWFPFERVKQGVLDTTAALYGVAFRRLEAFESWHPSVEAWEVLDRGTVAARFYLDLHPRAGKFKHAAMMQVVAGVEGVALPEAALVCNLPAPAPGDPALLLHDQVTTLFHEFGHLLHHLFAGRQRFLAFSGISTEHDFVEVPSQMYEEWAWSTDVLRTFALHFETGEPIPAELVATLRAAEEHGKSLHVLQQMFYALLSLSYYDRDPAGLDLTRTMLELKAALLPTRHEPDTHFHASFGHLHGYSAIYYTYMWSLVIAKDLFSRFEDDLMDGATANAYRASVLAPGGSRDADDLVRDFLGREYAFGAFERWLAR